jgi:hypothetical protein
VWAHNCGGGDTELTQGSESYVLHLLDDIVNLAPDDGPSPQCRGVKGYLPPNLTNIQAMCLKRMAVVEEDWLVIAEVDECVPKHSWEPQAMLAHGTKTPILADGVVGVVVHVHLKNSHKNITNPKVITSEK